MIDRIENNYPETSVEVKRLYIGGVDIFAKCPVCGKSVEYDSYFHYPKVNVPIEIYFYCGCDENIDGWYEKIIIRLGVAIPKL